MPILYYVPIIHSIEEFGYLAPRVKNMFSSPDTFDCFQEHVYTYWAFVQERVEAAISDPAGLIIYQDGVPIGNQKKIFALLDMSAIQSPNYTLLKKLVTQGAVLEGTEDPALVREQAAIYTSILQAASTKEQNDILCACGERILELVRLRDIFITERIRQTLVGEARGILFLGAKHRILPELEKLPDEYTIVCL